MTRKLKYEKLVAEFEARVKTEEEELLIICPALKLAKPLIEYVKVIHDDDYDIINLQISGKLPAQLQTAMVDIFSKVIRT